MTCQLTFLPEFSSFGYNHVLRDLFFSTRCSSRSAENLCLAWGPSWTRSQETLDEVFVRIRDLSRPLPCPEVNLLGAVLTDLPVPETPEP